MINAAVFSPSSISQPITGNLSPQQIEQTKAAAQDFEAVFLSEMMSHMFKGIKTDSVFGGGAGEDIFRGMLVQEYGKQMANGHGIGISDQLQKVMIQMQQQL
ncbi:MAG: rod-binding protein [Alphaproteobacteria bacterium]|nr:rod-binding protein [Alphaproteobacteria bacterium]